MPGDHNSDDSAALSIVVTAKSAHVLCAPLAVGLPDQNEREPVRAVCRCQRIPAWSHEVRKLAGTVADVPHADSIEVQDAQ